MLPPAEIVGDVGPVTLSVHSAGGGLGASGGEAAQSWGLTAAASIFSGSGPSRAVHWKIPIRASGVASTGRPGFSRMVCVAGGRLFEASNVFSSYPPWSRRRRTQETGVVKEKESHHTSVHLQFMVWCLHLLN